jgi:hypothetical protein
MDGTDNYSYVYLGGFDGAQATDLVTGNRFRPIFKGTDLLSMTSPFLDVHIIYAKADNAPLNSGSGDIAGEVYFTIFVS